MPLIQRLRRFATILRSLGVLWPSWVFVIVLAVCFLALPQGKDILLFNLESSWSRLFSNIAVHFAAVVTWYTLRLVGYTYLCTIDKTKFISKHTGRLSGFSVYTVMIMAYLHVLLQWAWYYSLLVFTLSFVVYKLVLILGKRITRHIYKLQGASARKLSLTLWFISWLIIIGGFLLGAFMSRPEVMVVGLALSQFSFGIQMVCRKVWTDKLYQGQSALEVLGLDAKTGRLSEFVRRFKERVFAGILHVNKACVLKVDLTYKKIQEVGPDNRLEIKRAGSLLGLPVQRIVDDLEKDAMYFFIFNVLSITGMVLLIVANYSIGFANAGGPLTWVLLGLAGILGSVNLLRTLSRSFGIGIFVLLLIWALVVGKFSGSHKLDQETVAEGQIIPIRPTYRQALAQWYSQQTSSRVDSTIPLVFVMSDGGALRSGYWASLIFDELDTQTQNRFGPNVFAFSGASGGNVGNATYYSALRSGVVDPASKARSILNQDIFSFTAARMLWNDVLNHLVPVFPDRGDGLIEALEHVSHEQSDVDLSQSFQSYFANTSKNTWHPHLCMGTTRIQDAAPALISTLDIQESQQFMHRVDVWDRMLDGTQVSMASMATLGARFPYVSPGGGLETDSGGVDYYVDGGYMDNSGAGIVLEMILSLEQLQRDSNKYKDVVPLIIHIKNSENSKGKLKKVHPVTNDLAAPVITLFGSYGAQTNVLTDRLVRYLETKGWWDRYIDMNLFEKLDTSLSYNWLMSQATKELMEAQLVHQQDHIQEVIDKMGLE